MENNKRKIKFLVEGIRTSDGAGVNLTRIIGSLKLNMLDPFLLLDEFGSDNPNDYMAGFPPHPHRGFETITYMINGKWLCLLDPLLPSVSSIGVMIYLQACSRSNPFCTYYHQSVCGWHANLWFLF